MKTFFTEPEIELLPMEKADILTNSPSEEDEGEEVHL